RFFPCSLLPRKKRLSAAAIGGFSSGKPPPPPRSLVRPLGSTFSTADAVFGRPPGGHQGQFRRLSGPATPSIPVERRRSRRRPRHLLPISIRRDIGEPFYVVWHGGSPSTLANLTSTGSHEDCPAILTKLLSPHRPAPNDHRPPSPSRPHLRDVLALLS
ncbi:hypothetical protein EJB05_33002, partial [Eragrostis curvula]